MDLFYMKDELSLEDIGGLEDIDAVDEKALNSVWNIDANKSFLSRCQDSANTGLLEDISKESIERELMLYRPQQLSKKDSARVLLYAAKFDDVSFLLKNLNKITHLDQYITLCFNSGVIGFKGSALIVALNVNSLNVAKALIEAGANVNATDLVSQLPPLFPAIKNCMRNETPESYNIVRLLLEKGANPNYSCQNSIYGTNNPINYLIRNIITSEACPQSRTKKDSLIVRLLLLLTMHGANINSQAGINKHPSLTPLVWSYHLGLKKTMLYLISQGGYFVRNLADPCDAAKLNIRDITPEPLKQQVKILFEQLMQAPDEAHLVAYQMLLYIMKLEEQGVEVSDEHLTDLRSKLPYANEAIEKAHKIKHGIRLDLSPDNPWKPCFFPSENTSLAEVWQKSNSREQDDARLDNDRFTPKPIMSYGNHLTFVDNIEGRDNPTKKSPRSKGRTRQRLDTQDEQTFKKTRK